MTSQPTPTQIKEANRAAKEAALAAKQLALPDRRYGVIVADPPWRLEPYSRETGMDRAADNHYVTAGTEEIARFRSRPSQRRVACSGFGRFRRCSPMRFM